MIDYNELGLSLFFPKLFDMNQNKKRYIYTLVALVRTEKLFASKLCSMSSVDTHGREGYLRAVSGELSLRNSSQDQRVLLKKSRM